MQVVFLDMPIEIDQLIVSCASKAKPNKNIGGLLKDRGCFIAMFLAMTKNVFSYHCEQNLLHLQDGIALLDFRCR
jgi:hypothetical protein